MTDNERSLPDLERELSTIEFYETHGTGQVPNWLVGRKEKLTRRVDAIYAELWQESQWVNGRERGE